MPKIATVVNPQIKHWPEARTLVVNDGVSPRQADGWQQIRRRMSRRGLKKRYGRKETRN